MTHANLIKSLSAAIKSCLSKVTMPTEYATTAENFTPINIFTQFLPRDLFDDTAYYPMVMIELISIEDDLIESSSAEIGITIGVYAKEEDGWQDAFHLMEIIRLQLLTERVVAKKFRLQSLEWSMPSEQPLPFFFLIANAKYSTFLPQERINI